MSKISRDQVKFLWHSNYWDGPLSGMCLYQGQKYWFEIIDEFWSPKPDEVEENFSDDYDPTRTRTFKLIELSPEQLKDETVWHRYFQIMVGRHCDYDKNGKRVPKRLRYTEESFKKFYDAAKTRGPRDYSSNKVVGYFDE